MKALLDRQLMAHLATVTVVTVGGWIAVAAPQADELHEIEKSLAEVKASVKVVQEGSVEELARRMEAVRTRVKQIVADNGFVSDSAQMYSVMKGRAAEQGVAITRIVPGAATAAQDDASVLSASFDLTVEGRYEQVVAFLESLDESGGFLQPVRLRVTPLANAGTALVRCEAGFQTFCFGLPEALKPLAGNSYADR